MKNIPNTVMLIFGILAIVYFFKRFSVNNIGATPSVVPQNFATGGVRGESYPDASLRV